MRASLVVALVGAAAVPVAIETGIGPLDPASFSEGDLAAKAEEIAREQFAANATLTVLDVSVTDHRIGTFGEKIKADPGYQFHVAHVRIENTGKVDIAVSTWHFSGIDEMGSDHSVELANAHEDFDASRLGKGHARDGDVIFELEKGSYLSAVSWQGDLAEAEGPAPEYSH